jgi:hypothetical protein
MSEDFRVIENLVGGFIPAGTPLYRDAQGRLVVAERHIQWLEKRPTPVSAIADTAN